MSSLRELLPETSGFYLRADAVFEALRRGVLEGKLIPGQHLRQETLAEEFGVSQITVRDALNKLVAEGLAVRTPYKGVRVIELSINELREVYSMRTVLEGWATELAAARISPDELAQLREVLPDSYVTSDPASIERARWGNRQFHEIIIRASGHHLLERTLKDIWNRMDPMTFYGRVLPTGQGEEFLTEWGEKDRQNHTALLDALENHDGPRARQVVAGYIEEIWNVLEEMLDSTLESGVPPT